MSALHVMLVQELGWNIENHDDFLVGYWDVMGKKRQLVFFVDADDGMIYISTRFEHREIDKGGMETLLKENVKRALVKFGMDACGNVMILAEIGGDATAEALRETVFRVCKAAAWHVAQCSGG